MSKVREILLKNDDNTFNNCFGHNLKCYRKRLGVNQEELAHELNYSLDQVRNWEQGRNIPNVDVLDRICSYLNCDMDHLLGRLPEKTHDNHFICEATGLSEAAVSNICDLNALYIQGSSCYKKLYGMKRVGTMFAYDLAKKLIPTASILLENKGIFEYIFDYLHKGNLEEASTLSEDYIYAEDGSVIDVIQNPHTLDICDNHLSIDGIVIDSTDIELGILRKIQDELDFIKKQMPPRESYRDEAMRLIHANDQGEVQ